MELDGVGWGVVVGRAAGVDGLVGPVGVVGWVAWDRSVGRFDFPDRAINACVRALVVGKAINDTLRVLLRHVR